MSHEAFEAFAALHTVDVQTLEQVVNLLVGRLDLERVADRLAELNWLDVAVLVAVPAPNQVLEAHLHQIRRDAHLALQRA